MAYATDFTNANDSGLQEKVRVAAVNAATQIVGEAWGGNGVLNAKRHALGVAVLADGGLSQLERFMFAACAGGSVTTASTDAQIDARLSAVWNDLAGVQANDT